MDLITPQSEQGEHQSLAPEVSRRHFLNKKFGITLAILLLLGSGAYAGIWYWQKQQIVKEVAPMITPRTGSMTNWKTYTNMEYGFQLQYPSDWVYDGTSEIFFDKIDPVTGKRQFSEGTGGFNLSIMSGDINTEYVKVRNECQRYGTTLKIVDPIFSYQAIILSGKNGWQVNCSSEYGGPFTVTILPAKISKIIEITSGYKSSLHNQILSTLKFFDSIDTSTWKIYSNTKYGFEFKYPSDWTVQADMVAKTLFLYSPETSQRIKEEQDSNIAYDLWTQEDIRLIAKETVPNDPYSQIDPNNTRYKKVVVSGNEIGYYAIFLATHPDLDEDNNGFLAVEHNGKTYTFQFHNFRTADLPDIHKAILSTFKFTDPAGQFCGGIAGLPCPSGYACRLEGSYPDAGGTCIKN